MEREEYQGKTKEGKLVSLTQGSIIRFNTTREGNLEFADKGTEIGIIALNYGEGNFALLTNPDVKGKNYIYADEYQLTAGKHMALEMSSVTSFEPSERQEYQRIVGLAEKLKAEQKKLDNEPPVMNKPLFSKVQGPILKSKVNYRRRDMKR